MSYTIWLRVREGGRGCGVTVRHMAIDKWSVTALRLPCVLNRRIGRLVEFRGFNHSYLYFWVSRSISCLQVFMLLLLKMK